MITPQLIKTAREWLADNAWRDIDEDGIAELSEAAVIAGIARHYAGGIDQFILDDAPVQTSGTTFACINEMQALDEQHTEEAHAICERLNLEFDSTNVLIEGRTANEAEILTIRTAIRETVARLLGDDLTAEDIEHCGNPERGEFRGFLALDDITDRNQVAVNAGLCGPDGTPERLLVIAQYEEAFSAEIISRYVAAKQAEKARASR